MTMNPFLTQSLLRLSDVRSRTGLGKTKIYQLIRDKKFPEPIHPDGARVSVWSSIEIDLWIEEQLRNRQRGTELSIKNDRP